MKWTDTREIAIALSESYPEIAPLSIGFTELRRLVIALIGFDDDPNKSNEKILEAIQMTWLDEVE